jgi:hypothetical protein
MLHPWPGNVGCLTAMPKAQAAPKLLKAIDVMMSNPAFDEFSIFGPSSRESRLS